LTSLGLLAVGLYGIHGAHELSAGRPESLLWSCHLASLAVGLGLLLRRPTWIAIGLMWLVLGLPLWAMEVVFRSGFEPTAALTHVGGLVLGMFGIRRLGLAGPVWWKAAAALAVLHLVSRWTTPEKANVNLAFAIWPGWEPYFPSRGVYLVTLLLLGLAVFGGTEYALRRTGFAAPDTRAHLREQRQ
jgi:hypothetical protein